MLVNRIFVCTLPLESTHDLNLLYYDIIRHNVVGFLAVLFGDQSHHDDWKLHKKAYRLSEKYLDLK